MKPPLIWQMGTSPRTRGKHFRLGDVVLVERNIPAHAGKTSPVRGTPSLTKEHPRARGENPGGPAENTNILGTSPRTRGKHRYFCSETLHMRNIPAHAGKTYRPFTIVMYQSGTSPRTRGKLLLKHFWREELRNIPAHAGKTCQAVMVRGWSQEHPRARGENIPRLHQHAAGRGTSPRTRGKLSRKHQRSQSRRNIPAHAGKTPAYVAFSASG